MKCDEAKNVTFSFVVIMESYCTDILYYFSLMTNNHAEVGGIVNIKI
jgi:hypothetical protein